MAIKSGDKIKIEYEGSLDDGTIFDSSEKQGKPLEFTIGQNQIIPGLEKEIIGMEKEEEKQINILAKDAYGEKREELFKKIPKKQLPEGLEPKKGIVLGLQAPNGQQFPAPIIDVSEDEITIDLNHPLAGKNLNFKVKIINIEE
jgi:FKBP-type peptidyl-prolyl cis-trans isomerase 2